MQTINIQLNKKLTKKTQAHGTRKILLIDDKKDSALSAALAQKGYDVIHCDSVQKAWSLVYPQRPYLIIFRLYNSKRAVLDDLRECRALAGGVPIILATSAQVNETLMKPLRHLSAGILALPLAPETIRKVLNDLGTSTMRR